MGIKKAVSMEFASKEQDVIFDLLETAAESFLDTSYLEVTKFTESSKSS